MKLLRILSSLKSGRTDADAVRRRPSALRNIRVYSPPDPPCQWGEWQPSQTGIQCGLSVRFRSVRNELMTSRYISTVQIRNDTGAEVCFGLELNGDRGERLLRTHVWVSPQEISEWMMDARRIVSLRIGALKVLAPACEAEGRVSSESEISLLT